MTDISKLSDEKIAEIVFTKGLGGKSEERDFFTIKTQWFMPEGLFYRKNQEMRLVGLHISKCMISSTHGPIRIAWA